MTTAVMHDLSNFPWITGLGAEVTQALLTCLHERRLDAGERLFSIGDPGDRLYLVQSGRLLVVRDPPEGRTEVIAEVGPGACVGEMALLTGGQRTASVDVHEASLLLELTREDFETTCHDYPGLRDLLGGLALHRLSALKLLESGLLAGLNRETQQCFARHAAWRRYSLGADIFSAGDPADGLYLVVHGRVLIRDVSGAAVAILGPGETLGEVSLAPDDIHTRGAKAIRETDVVWIDRRALVEVGESDPRSLLAIIAHKARIDRRWVTELRLDVEQRRNTCIAILAPPELADSARSLGHILASMRPSLYLDAEGFAEIHGARAAMVAPSEPRLWFLREWMEGQEQRFTQILLQSFADSGTWLETCAKLADRIVVLLPGSQEPTAAALWRFLHHLALKTPLDIVRIHPPTAIPIQDSLVGPSPSGDRRIHQARLGSESDLRRVARFLTGRAKGLVLGAGGARAFAHLGVYRALCEYGLDIDYVGGSSMGALIATLIAADLPQADMQEVLRHMLVNRPKGIHLTLPLLSLLSIRRAQDRFHGVFGERHIEALWRPCFCVSVNLSTGQEHIHHRGPAWAAVRASIAIPGVFSPFFDQGNIFVDGAVLNSLPVEIMRGVCPGAVFASDVNSTEDLAADSQMPNTPSIPQLILGRLGLGPSRSAPNMVGLLMRALEVTSMETKRRNATLARAWFRPPVGSYRILDMRPLDAIVEVGYRYAMDYLASRPDLLSDSPPASDVVSVV